MKYTIDVKFKNGQISSHQAEEIRFHPGGGGIDIFDSDKEYRIPFFPGHEEDVEEITVRLNA